MGDRLLPGRDVDRAERIGHRGDRLHAARTRSTSPVVMPCPSVPPERPLVAAQPVRRSARSVVGREPVAASFEAVADLDPLIAWMPISAGQAGVDPPVPVHGSPGPAAARARRPDDTAEGVAVPGPGRSPRPEFGMGVGVEAADGVVVEAGHVPGTGQRPAGARTPPSLDDVRHDPCTHGPLEVKVRGDLTQRHPRGRLRAEARSRTGRASSKSYFCMPTRSAWPGWGCVSGALQRLGLQDGGVDGSADMTCSPLGPLGAVDPMATGLPWSLPWRTPLTNVTRPA